MSGVVVNKSKECYTLSGHLIGMLDRDQRTVINRKSSEFLDVCPICAAMTSTFRENSQHAQTANEVHKHQRKSPSVWRVSAYPRWNMLRIKNVLTVFIYLLLVIPTALSAPSGHGSTSMSQPQEDPFWILNENIQPEENITDALKVQLAKTIQTQAKIACNKANHSLEEYTRNQFSMTPEQVHQRYHAAAFDWLPSRADIPKQFGQDVGDGFSRSMEEEMIHLYQQFQKIGVGIEQIVHESNDCKPNGMDQTLCDNFNMMRQDLTTLLRELNMNIATLGLTRMPDVSRDIMPQNDRQVDETARRIRNWVIYRDYINALEYTIKAFESHF